MIISQDMARELEENIALVERHERAYQLSPHPALRISIESLLKRQRQVRRWLAEESRRVDPKSAA